MEQNTQKEQDPLTTADSSASTHSAIGVRCGPVISEGVRRTSTLVVTPVSGTSIVAPPTPRSMPETEACLRDFAADMEAAATPHPNRHTHGLPTVGDVLYARKWRMPFKVGIHLMGYSRGHDVTCFSVPEWRVQLDVGT